MINRYSSLNIYLYPLDICLSIYGVVYCLYLLAKSDFRGDFGSTQDFRKSIRTPIYEINIVNDKYYTMNTSILYFI